ncbi:hypothetical protein B0H14DRAFT_2601531 [Mycena olivaceomarginata]|nr:hypothetical protein B0H14DRAFT_2601531 [Mycena olivaceomarginata]
MRERLPAAATGTRSSCWERRSADPPTSTIASASQLASVRKTPRASGARPVLTDTVGVQRSGNSKRSRRSALGSGATEWTRHASDKQLPFQLRRDTRRCTHEFLRARHRPQCRFQPHALHSTSPPASQKPVKENEDCYISSIFTKVTERPLQRRRHFHLAVFVLRYTSDPSRPRWIKNNLLCPQVSTALSGGLMTRKAYKHFSGVLRARILRTPPLTRDTTNPSRTALFGASPLPRLTSPQAPPSTISLRIHTMRLKQAGADVRGYCGNGETPGGFDWKQAVRLRKARGRWRLSWEKAVAAVEVVAAAGAFRRVAERPENNVGDLGGGLTSVEHSAERVRPLMGGRSVRKHGWRAITFERCQLSGLDLARFCPEKPPQKYVHGGLQEVAVGSKAVQNMVLSPE